MIPWDDLPEEMKNCVVMRYYYALNNKKTYMVFKRVIDFILALFMLILLSPIILMVCVVIKLDSNGPIVFKQVRYTQYMRPFYIYKFRSMYINQDHIKVTTANDPRITRVGHFLRKSRIDEFPQLINIIKGDMSFVGTRPEVKKYIDAYTDDMYATFLLPAGLTSKASLEYKDEALLMKDADSAEEVYINKILPEKMKINIDYVEQFGFKEDLRIMINTPIKVLKRND